jgi:hypothetical protein
MRVDRAKEQGRYRWRERVRGKWSERARKQNKTTRDERGRKIRFFCVCVCVREREIFLSLYLRTTGGNFNKFFEGQRNQDRML